MLYNCNTCGETFSFSAATGLQCPVCNSQDVNVMVRCFCFGCNKEFTFNAELTSRTVITCPKCKKHKVRKVAKTNKSLWICRSCETEYDPLPTQRVIPCHKCGSLDVEKLKHQVCRKCLKEFTSLERMPSCPECGSLDVQSQPSDDKRTYFREVCDIVLDEIKSIGEEEQAYDTESR